MRLRTSALLLALVMSLCAWQAHAQETYRLTKIEGLTFFGGLNRNGVVVGATRAANGAQHAAVWQRGQLTDIHNRIDSNAVQSDLRGVNDKLDMVGTFVDPNFRGFLLSGRRVTEIKPLPGDEFLFATGLNERKQVIGSSSDSTTGLSRQFVWDRGLARRAVLWQNGTVMDIGGLPGSFGNESGAINDVGQISGHSVLSDPNIFPQQVNAFVWRDGVARALPSLFSGVTASRTLGINNSSSRR
jgi:uncharacterized membrane protein